MTHDATPPPPPTCTTTIDEEEEEEAEEKEQYEDCTDAAPNEPDSTPWHIFGTACPKEEIVFLCQVVVLYTVILISIYNLTTGNGDSNLWTALLSSSLGYLLPNPTLRRNGD